ncbi:hypothetical protein BpHYR1_026650 [Brachionus plicatilis]|uniref:Uncharacterized protein n=1 Tax=Brachionus plicatilis TaxID=10195 RepID=A0A3M7RMH3_BRAPC|nr:hypothetical protein BpHYR1_026650 [Brachionus plicatilis]
MYVIAVEKVVIIFTLIVVVVVVNIAVTQSTCVDVVYKDTSYQLLSVLPMVTLGMPISSDHRTPREHPV